MLRRRYLMNQTHEFGITGSTICDYNYVTMNADQTTIFGLDENRKDVKRSLPVIQHTPDGAYTVMAHSQSAAIHIKHLGLWMNMHLDWSRAISDISSKIGHRHIVMTNSWIGFPSSVWWMPA
jgi:hypothetical protein